MSKHTSSSWLETSCTDKCKYKEHGKNITSVITKNSNISDYQLACYINSICKNYAQVVDDEGRNALHMAASCGRRDLCYWLVKVGQADINSKDQESGYTALHRSIFYGHISNAVSLIQMGAQVQVMDKEDLQPIDHAMKDRLVKEFSVHNPCQVYAWGTNYNYTLGIGNHHSRQHPELLDFFRKNNTSIKQVAIDKFHSVFVSSTGRAWACGHGQGGRLGVDSEQMVLTPQRIRIPVELVMSASVGRNHTILLMESGAVWTCGSNDHHVLGHSPPPPALHSPRPIQPRHLKAAGSMVTGVAAARFHSVFWSESAILTCGLHGGQLGHPQFLERTVVIPKQVMGISLGQKHKIVDVAVSVGATAVIVNKGDIWVLHNYQVRRIASRMLDAVKVSVFGGELNADVDPKLSAKGGEELKVMVLNSLGNIFLWQESFPTLTRCIYPLKRSLTFTGISLCRSCALLTTADGEGYLARVKPKLKKKVAVSIPKSENTPFNRFIETLDSHHISINRVPHIHRAVHISADPKGQNFIVIQENPKVNLTDIPIVGDSEFPKQLAALLNDAHEDDSLHDILIESDRYSVAAHHLILAMVSEEFANMSRSGTVRTVTLEGVDREVLLQVLTFAYTHDCDIIHPGPFQTNLFKGDIVKAALDLAKLWKISTLIKCLHLLKYEEGSIKLKEEGNSVQQVLGERLPFERLMLANLHDVSIASSDGASFRAHKCVLAARLDYFNSMFTGGWVEAEATTNLSLPIPQTILREVLDFLYKDEAVTLIESQDVDYISSVLVVADQLFITRLKQICEVALSGNISLRNAAYLLQLAITYNADQLKCCCMQFISLNLAAVLETRILDILDNSTLEELSRYYRNMIPAMCKRIITPFTTDVSEDDIVDIANSCGVTWLDSEELTNDDELIITKLNKSNPTPTGGKKKVFRNRKSSESQRKRIESVSSNSDLDCSLDTSSEKVVFEDLVELDQKNKKEEWVTVDKAQKTVQNRLKALVTAAHIQPTQEAYIRLVPPSLNSSIAPSTSPSINPHPVIQDNRQFPELSSTPPKMGSSPKSSYIEIKRSPAVKLSQKQRKKLLADGGMKEPEPEPEPVRTPWATINNNIDCSLADIMRSARTVGSPPTRGPDQGFVKFADIMAEEIQQRDNLCKMKSKSLQLTQIEDKAMEELRVFYNAAHIYEERITVERVLSANIAKPIWITSRHQ
ncbi:inhibitor of Bruton tyrosine kinase isoform X1 [Homalodisca vitripennis]|uniref:inhibitor of Bruton tyrosine kinase isoform X1 n=1 Tax=Homalodisca vitripennis TaxID=197043 RepID=UPI001EEA6189|nr:inhibitor of Bruton tyrosine kinase isoform X1 [Homalodisca vitripennis]XP_046673436.1 inhibitor of Bruton tyrosine kinase isoform X1 [Homalodisca vitripennis]